MVTSPDTQPRESCAQTILDKFKKREKKGDAREAVADLEARLAEVAVQLAEAAERLAAAQEEAKPDVKPDGSGLRTAYFACLPWC